MSTVSTSSGFVSTAAGLAAIASPAAFGIITDLTGSYRLPFVMSIGLLLVGIVLSFWIRADRPLAGSAKPTLPTESLGVHS